MLNLFITKTDYPISISLELLGTLLVLFNLRQVDTSIDFNYQAAGRTVKIGNKGSQRGLPAEFKAVQLAVTQLFPE